MTTCAVVADAEPKRDRDGKQCVAGADAEVVSPERVWPEGLQRPKAADLNLHDAWLTHSRQTTGSTMLDIAA